MFSGGLACQRTYEVVSSVVKTQHVECANQSIKNQPSVSSHFVAALQRYIARSIRSKKKSCSEVRSQLDYCGLTY